MADKDENENPFDVTKFFSDPKHSEQASFMRNSIKHVFGEMAAEEETARLKESEEIAKKKPRKPENVFEFLFGVKK